MVEWHRSSHGMLVDGGRGNFHSDAQVKNGLRGNVYEKKGFDRTLRARDLYIL